MSFLNQHVPLTCFSEVNVGSFYFVYEFVVKIHIIVIRGKQYSWFWAYAPVVTETYPFVTAIKNVTPVVYCENHIEHTSS